ncbi:MAG: lipopolysaccharide biosynthesis protein [Bacteroidales bacterium]|nr:lipopolysaccharide biosynthesis protein [Bacteroidales bacterium]
MANSTSLKKLFSDSVIYGLSSIIGRFLNYLLTPLYTYTIAAATGGYGVVTNVYAYTALLLVLLTFGMETTYFYFANRQSEKGTDERRLFSTTLTAVGCVSALFVVLVFIFIGPIAMKMGYPDHHEYLRTMACIVAIDAFQSILFARIRQFGKAWKFFGLKMTFITLSMALNLIFFLVAPHWSHLPWMSWYHVEDCVAYIFYINLFCTAVVTFGFAKELKDYRLLSFDWQLLKKMLAYAWPLLIFGIVGVFNQVADKIMLPKLIPGDDGRVKLGIYGACVKIAMIMALITQAFRYAYEPFVFGGQRDKSSKQTQAQATKYFIMFTLLAFLAVMCYMDVLKHFVSPDYWEALPAVPIVMMAEIFMGIYFNLSFWYKLIGKTWWGAVMSACGCAVLVAINIIFVPRIGYMACAWGGFFGYAVCMVMSYLIGQKKYPIPYPMKSITASFAVAMVLFAVMHYVQPSNMTLRLVFNTVLLLVYVAYFLLSERELTAKVLARLRR